MNGDTTGVWLVMSGLACLTASTFLCLWMGKFPAISPTVSYLPKENSQIQNKADSRLNRTQFLARPRLRIPYIGDGQNKTRLRI